MRTTLCGILAVASLAVLGGCNSSSSIPSVPTAPPQNFKTTFGGFFQVTGGSPPANVIIAGTGIGLDSSGDSHAAFAQTIVFTTNPNQINAGTFTFTYADGSTLTGTYSGTASPPDANGYTNGNGNFTVGSGTGRFTKTTGNMGTWTVSAQIFPPGSMPAGTINVTFQGSLTL
jgi:hypothetical protein